MRYYFTNFLRLQGLQNIWQFTLSVLPRECHGSIVGFAKSRISCKENDFAVNRPHEILGKIERSPDGYRRFFNTGLVTCVTRWRRWPVECRGVRAKRLCRRPLPDRIVQAG